MRILAVYASAHGSTAEVGRYIADVLQARGIETAVTAAESAPPVEAGAALADHEPAHPPPVVTSGSARRGDLHETHVPAHPVF